MKKRLGHALSVVIMVIALFAQPTSAKTYVGFTVDQYHHFDPFERFMQYIPSLGLGWNTGNAGIEFNFNLYEEVDGPESVHSKTPWTIESYLQRGNSRWEANALVFVDVYDEDHPYQETMIEAKVRRIFSVGPMKVQAIPSVRIFDKHGGIVEVSLGAGVSLGWVTLGVNMLDVKDYYMLGRGENVATARIDVPLSNGNQMTAELNKVLGKEGRDSINFVYRFDFANLLEF